MYKIVKLYSKTLKSSDQIQKYFIFTDKKNTYYKNLKFS